MTVGASVVANVILALCPQVCPIILPTLQVPSYILSSTAPRVVRARPQLLSTLVQSLSTVITGAAQKEKACFDSAVIYLSQVCLSI